MTTSHCQLQPNDSGPERIEAEDGFALDVRQSFALGVNINSDEMIDIPRRTKRPGALAGRQDRWCARTARWRARAGSAEEGKDVIPDAQLDGAETASRQEWGLRRPLGFQSPKRSPQSHDVPSTRNCVRKILGCCQLGLARAVGVHRQRL